MSGTPKQRDETAGTDQRAAHKPTDLLDLPHFRRKRLSEANQREVWRSEKLPQTILSHIRIGNVKNEHTTRASCLPGLRTESSARSLYTSVPKKIRQAVK